jgi:actin-related protein
MAETTAIVIDNGSGVCKAGFSGEEDPVTTFPSIIGKPRRRGGVRCIDYDVFVGQDAQNQRDVLSIAYPIERGIVQNWEDMESIWDYIFKTELKVDPQKHPIMLTEAPINPVANR